MKHPIQPLVTDAHGVVRFKENAIVNALLNFASTRGMSLNEIARMGFEANDREQFAQLIGYSLSGAGSLSYITDYTYEVAEAMHEKGLTEEQARIAYLEQEISALRSALVEPMARLFGKHPDDLRQPQ